MIKTHTMLLSTLLFCGAICAAEPAAVIDDHFNRIQLEKAMVAIEDHPEKEPWYFNGPQNMISCTDGILTLGSPAGGREVRMISKLKFKSGRIDARIRLNKTGEGIHFYIGFQENRPWNNRSAWILFNNSGNGHLYMKNEKNRMPRNMIEKIRTGKLEAGKWYDLAISLDNSGAELFVDGQSRGKLALPECTPDGGLNVMFIVNPGGQGSSLSIDRVIVSGQIDNTRKQAVSKKKVAIPVPPPATPDTGKKIDPEFPLLISRDGNKVTMENRYFSWIFNTSDGLQLTGIINKFSGRNMLRSPSPVFIVYQNNAPLSNSGFQVKKTAISKSSSGEKVIFHLKNDREKLAAEISFSARSDSPELRSAFQLVNTSGSKKTAGICFPVISGIQAGEKLADDEFFYPMESGMAGKLNCVLRHTYGMTNFMQLMSVSNPQSAGGLYAYTREKSGYPLIMELKRRDDTNAQMHSYSAIVWRELDKSNFPNAPGTSIAWRHLDMILTPEEKSDIPEATIGISAGSWHAGLESYAAFVKSWFKKPYPTPHWYNEMYACLSAHAHSGLWSFSPSPSKGFYDKKNNRYSYGQSITHLEKNALQEIAGWWDMPEKLDLPTEELRKYRLPSINFWAIGDYDYPVRRGGLTALKNEIKLIHDKGSRVIFYTFPQGIAKGTRAYNDCRKFAAKNAYGRFKTNYTGDDMGWFCCAIEPGFADYYSKIFAEKIAETGADGYRLDVLSRTEACYNPEHKHFDGSMRSSTDAVLLGEALKKFKGELFKVSPEKIVTVEHAGSDYISQFHDGYFSENICWISESPQWAHFRNLNAYMTVFTRFYFPEIKTWIHGASNSDEAVRMSLFNACGFACTSHKGIQTFRTLEENSDTFDSTGRKLPHIPTPVPQVFANSFAPETGSKQIWTVFNRSGKTQSELLFLENISGDFRYIDVYRDEEAHISKRDGKNILTYSLPDNEVAVITRFDRQLKAVVNNGELVVTATDTVGKHCRILFGKDDFMRPPEDIKFTGSEIRTVIPAGTDKIIIKLYNGKYLKDEMVIRG